MQTYNQKQRRDCIQPIGTSSDEETESQQFVLWSASTHRSHDQSWKKTCLQCFPAVALMSDSVQSLQFEVRYCFRTQPLLPEHLTGLDNWFWRLHRIPAEWKRSIIVDSHRFTSAFSLFPGVVSLNYPSVWLFSQRSNSDRTLWISREEIQVSMQPPSEQQIWRTSGNKHQ